MSIIEILPLSNGAHRNQSGGNACPDGWAIIPNNMASQEHFPFVNIEVEGQTVIAMTANEEAYQAYIDSLPEPEPEQPSELLQTQLALAELAETESQHDLENKLAIAELAETMTGGTDNG